MIEKVSGNSQQFPFQTIGDYQRFFQSESVRRVMEENQNLKFELEAVQESIAQIYIDIDNLGWTEIGQTADRKWDIDWTRLERARNFARLMYIQNPMVNRAVEVQKLYVWALGWELKANDTIIKEVLTGFLTDPKNECEFSLTALMDKEVNLRTTGDLFFIFFVNQTTGRVRVRTVDYEQITDVYRNPNDPKEVWWYKRKFVLVEDGQEKTQVVWHPDWEYNPARGRRADPRNRPNYSPEPRETLDESRPIFHVKVGGFDNMKFGFPEVYSILTWAKAYKKFLENWATLMQSYAVVAMQIINQSKAGAAAAKDKLNTKLSTNGIIGDGNPPPSTGAWASFVGGGELKAVRTSGATTSASEAHPLALMIASGAGIPITFFGEADVGNMATATTLDRPTELKFVCRQTQWSTWLIKILRFVLMHSAKAPNGKLSQAGVKYNELIDSEDGSVYPEVLYPTEMDSEIQIDFPDITEPNATERVRALAMGVTMMGKPMTDVVPDARMVCLWLLKAIGIKQPEKLVNMWYPPDQMTKPSTLNPEPANGLGLAPEEGDDAD